MTFDPFENRFCRDVRNTLGQGLVNAVETRSLTPFHAVIHQYPKDRIKGYIYRYIENRTTRLKKILDHITTCPAHPDEEGVISVLLWNHELFFEFHEWFERKWTASRGNNKKALQALILAAVVYEQLTYGRKTPAEKVASKAVLLFKRYRNWVPKLFDSELFIQKLSILDPVAPKFSLPDETG